MSSVFSFPASRPSLIACQTHRPYCPLLIHYCLLPFPPTHYSLNARHEDARLSRFFFVSFCFFSHCLAALLRSLPPHHMRVHGCHVNSSPSLLHHGVQDPSRIMTPAAPSHQHLQEVLAVLRSSSPYRHRCCFTARKPVAAASTLHMGVRHPITARKTHHDATSQCHHNTATMPCVIPLQHQLNTVRKSRHDKMQMTTTVRPLQQGQQDIYDNDDHHCNRATTTATTAMPGDHEHEDCGYNNHALTTTVTGDGTSQALMMAPLLTFSTV
ncbi:hypothetical protein EDB83DRAFT_28175 [Lactarius deliciosus]|nr:hypothetical protein EDB83DRAFT_28175 [Lactarius deliciosus]